MFPHTFLCVNGELGVRGKAVVSHLSISCFFLGLHAVLFLISLSLSFLSYPLLIL